MDGPVGGPVALGVTAEGADARFWYLREGVRTAIGPALDFSRLSDDHGSRLRFTGALAAIHARDLVDAAFTADFTGSRLTCTPGYGSCSGFRKF
ncbi:beta-xylosidase family glycoside hydrolase [Streptomyces massasporeus]|uniref:beta-xylosidase family glycoside hydrolase n=1 Tax=Streptomyces massasporeus TaxID=67324 RepID=UPI003649CF13